MTLPVRALAAVGLLAVVPCAPSPARAQSAAPTTAPDVAAKTIRIQVLGAVSRPGNVEINEGDRLLIALARAGVGGAAPRADLFDVPPRADLGRIVLVRVDPATGKNVSYVIDVYQAIRRGDQRYDPVLRADDRIYVPEARPFRPIQMAYSKSF